MTPIKEQYDFNELIGKGKQYENVYDALPKLAKIANNRLRQLEKAVAREKRTGKNDVTRWIDKSYELAMENIRATGRHSSRFAETIMQETRRNKNGDLIKTKISFNEAERQVADILAFLNGRTSSTGRIKELNEQIQRTLDKQYSEWLREQHIAEHPDEVAPPIEEFQTSVNLTSEQWKAVHYLMEQASIPYDSNTAIRIILAQKKNPLLALQKLVEDNKGMITDTTEYNKKVKEIKENKGTFEDLKKWLKDDGFFTDLSIEPERIFGV